jgi:hypothetical protein
MVGSDAPYHARSQPGFSVRAAVDRCEQETVGPYWHAALEAAGRPGLSVIGGGGIKNPDTPYICLHLPRSDRAVPRRLGGL